MDYLSKEDWVEYIFEKIKYFTLPSKKNEYRSKLLESNTLLCCAVLLLVLKVTTIFVGINIPQNAFFADITKSTLESFVNQTRQADGLQPLVQNVKLDEAAQLKAQNMVANNYFAHTSPSGLTPWYWFSQVGYKYKYAGENLAIGFFDSSEVYNAWLNSPEHKANIVNPHYTEVGTAVLSGFGNNNTIVVVQEFGSQLPIKTVAVNNNSKQVNTPKPIATLAPTPVIAVNQPIPTPVSTNERVLSQSIEAPSVITVAKPVNSNIYSNILGSIYNYSGLLQSLIYGVSLVVIGILLTMIFLNTDFNFRRNLVFRSVLIVVILSLATILSKELLISVIPHQVII